MKQSSPHMYILYPCRILRNSQHDMSETNVFTLESRDATRPEANDANAIMHPPRNKLYIYENMREQMTLRWKKEQHL